MRVHLSAVVPYPTCPIASDTKIGVGNVGTTMDFNAGGTVYTRQIQTKVYCLYKDIGYDFFGPAPTDPTELTDWQTMKAEADERTDTYIRHTAAHELYHNLHLRLLDFNERSDVRTYSKYEEHYPADDVLIMSQYVKASTKQGKVTLDIGTNFKQPEDAADAGKGFYVELPPPPVF